MFPRPDPPDAVRTSLLTRSDSPHVRQGASHMRQNGMLTRKGPDDAAGTGTPMRKRALTMQKGPDNADMT